jgi:hypothetical protein
VSPVRCLRPGEVRRHRTRMMLSIPMGFEQQGDAVFDRRITSASTCLATSGLATVAKLPKVFGCVFWIVNTVAEFAMPVIT